MLHNGLRYIDGNKHASMTDFLSSSLVVVAMLAWITVGIILPREMMRRWAVQHYREWIAERAYWGRSSNKWVLGNRIFYADELWDDIIVSLLLSTVTNLAFIFIAMKIGIHTADPDIVLAGLVASPVVLFLARIHDRFHVADEEIARRQAIDPAFSADTEMKRLLEGDQNYVRRICGRRTANFK